MITEMSGLTLRILLAAFVVLLFYLRYRIKNRKFYNVASKMPGPITVPILGNILTFALDPSRSISIGMEFVRK